MGAFFIGIIGAGAVIVGLEVLEYLRIDDPIGAVPVHMFAGIAGTISLGLFAAATYGVPTATGADATSHRRRAVLRRRHAPAVDADLRRR